jgi:agmatine deiminase
LSRFDGPRLVPACSLLLLSCASVTWAPPAPRSDLGDDAPAKTRAAAPSAPATDRDTLAVAKLRLAFADPFTDPPDDVVGLPGEFEPVERILLGWHGGNWDYVDFFVAVLREVLPDASALVAVEDEADQILLMDTLAAEGVDLSRVDFVLHELDSMWMRDYGPLLVRTAAGGYRVIDLPYHPDRARDDGYPTVFATREGLPVSRPPLEMEGGHLQADGTGRCIVTDSVLELNRGFLYEEADVRRLLRGFLGCRDVTFVPPLFAEETGHVDVFAYVTGPSRVLVGTYDRREDAVNARRLNRAARALRRAGWDVTRIRMPGNSRRTVFRTYTNVLVTDRTVVVPVFRRDRRFERHALRTFARAFPDRRVVGVAADGVIDLAGAVHCTVVTVPVLPRPAGRAARARARML